MLRDTGEVDLPMLRQGAPDGVATILGSTPTVSVVGVPAAYARWCDRILVQPRPVTPVRLKAELDAVVVAWPGDAVAPLVGGGSRPAEVVDFW